VRLLGLQCGDALPDLSVVLDEEGEPVGQGGVMSFSGAPRPPPEALP
jgi:hypothetical protein